MLYIDASCGAAGDMLIGALIDADADETVLDGIERETGVGFETRRVDRSNVSALKVDVGAGGDEVTRYSPEEDAHDHPDDHGDDDHLHRDYTEVIETVEDTNLPDAVVEDALGVFERIGRAEAAVHDVPLDELTFHEVGADDAIADVLAATALFHDLGVGTGEDDRAVATPVNVGGGRVRAAHGDVPAPVPATVEILRGTGLRMRGGPVERELLTPTGAALLAEFAEPVANVPEMSVDETGYGAGAQDFDDVPNVVRVVRGDESGGVRTEGIEVLETNLDDATPEVLGSLYDTLRNEGARDVYVTPTGMKKNRPGHLVQVLARPDDAERLARLLARETGTLGVRATPYTHRFVADRRIETVTVTLDSGEYDVDVKIASMDGEVYDVSAEYDDAALVADDADVPVREVLRAAEEAWQGR